MPEKNRLGVISLPIERIHIEVTNHCNFSCEFCPDFKMKRGRGFMDFEVLKKILNEVAEKGIAKLALFHVMGEALLYSKLPDAIKYASGKGLKTCITTNGSLLTNELLNKLTQAGLSRIILSLQTPDEKSFIHRGAKNFSFDSYKESVKRIAHKVINENRLKLTISFLSSPLRKLIFPVMPNITVADTSKDLRKHLSRWSEYILKGTKFENNLGQIRNRLRWVGSFRENSVNLCPGLTFETRILGDWASHSLNNGVKAKIGFCPGIQENFGILWNGDMVFCCVDYEGRTVAGNIKEDSIYDCLKSRQVQDVVRGFNHFRVIHSHCQRCMGDINYLNTFVRQIGSILYFKGYRKIFSNNNF